MATINSFDVNFNAVNQVTINFDEPITAIRPGDIFLEPDATSTASTQSLTGATVSGLGTSTIVLTLSDEVVYQIKNQTTNFRQRTTTALFIDNVDATVPALDAASTNYGLASEYDGDNTRATLVSASFTEDISVDANGDVTSFSFKTSKPLTTLPLITEISAVDTDDSSSVALTADSSLAKSTTDPTVIIVTVGTTDRTTFSDKFNIPTGALSVADTTARDWVGLTLAPSQQVDVTFIEGTIRVTAWDWNSNTNIALIVFDSSDVTYVDPSGFSFNFGGIDLTLTGGTVTQSPVDDAAWIITFNNADIAAYRQKAITNGGDIAPGDTYLNAVGTTFPQTAQLIQPLEVRSFVGYSLNLELLAYDLYTTDSSAPYDGIFTFNSPFFTSGSNFDVTDFTLADQQNAAPTNSRALTAGSTFTYLGANPTGGVRYGLSLNTADATAIDAWAASGSMFASVATGFSLDWAYNGITEILPANGLAPDEFLTSISPDNEYVYGDIAVRSDNLAGELKLTSSYKYDAITLRANDDTQVGGVYQFGEAPSSNYAGRYLTITSADTTDANYPVFTLDWAEQGVTRLIAGSNITLTGQTGDVIISSTASGGGGATHYTGDAGDVPIATNAQINAAISGTPVNGDSFVNTNAGANNTQPYYVYVNNSWGQVSFTASA